MRKAGVASRKTFQSVFQDCQRSGEVLEGFPGRSERILFPRGWSGLGPTSWELQEGKLAGRSGVRSGGDGGGGQLHVVLVDKRTGLAGGGEELGMSSRFVAGTSGRMVVEPFVIMEPWGRPSRLGGLV